MVEQLGLLVEGGQHGIGARRWQCIAGIEQISAISGVAAHVAHSASIRTTRNPRCDEAFTRTILSRSRFWDVI